MKALGGQWVSTTKPKLVEMSSALRQQAMLLNRMEQQADQIAVQMPIFGNGSRPAKADMQGVANAINDANVSIKEAIDRLSRLVANT